MDLEQRVEKLEWENRRLKLVGGAVAAVLVAAALVGAAMPQEIPDLVETRELRVIGDGGDWFFRVAYEEDVLAGIVEYRHYSDRLFLAPGLLDLRGMSIGVRDDNERELFLAPEFVVLGNGGELSDADLIALADDDPSNDPALGSRVVISADGFALRDDGRTRLELGRVDLVTPSTGAQTHYPAAVVLYDQDGNVIWQAPR